MLKLADGVPVKHHSGAVFAGKAEAGPWQKFYGRFGHLVKCARIAVAESFAPHPEPHGMSGPDGRPPRSTLGTPRRQAHRRRRPPLHRVHSGLKASTGDS